MVLVSPPQTGLQLDCTFTLNKNHRTSTGTHFVGGTGTILFIYLF